MSKVNDFMLLGRFWAWVESSKCYETLDLPGFAVVLTQVEHEGTPIYGTYFHEAVLFGKGANPLVRSTACVNQYLALESLHTKCEALYRIAYPHAGIKANETLADYLHDTFCTSEHTERCAWFYEGDNWSLDTHQRWLKKAEDFVKMLNQPDGWKKHKQDELRRNAMSKLSKEEIQALGLK